MKNKLLASCFLFAYSLNSATYVMETEKSIIEGRIIIQKYTDEELANAPSSCQQIRDRGEDNDSGSYVVIIGGEEQIVNCDFSGNGDVYTEMPFSLALLDDPEIEIYSTFILNSSYNNGTYNHGHSLSQEDIDQYKELIDNNATHLVRQRIKAHRNGSTANAQDGHLLLRMNGSFYWRESVHQLPAELSGLNSPHALVYARLSSRSTNGDNDRSRMWFAQRNNGSNITSTIRDSGYGNWNATPNYVRWGMYIDPSATEIRFYGACDRNHGTQCSADVLDYTFVLYPKLPQVGETVTIR